MTDIVERLRNGWLEELNDEELCEATDEIERLLKENQELKLQYLSDQGQWIEETGRLRAALRGVIRVADRKTVEFDAARAALGEAVCDCEDGFRPSYHMGTGERFMLECHKCKSARAALGGGRVMTDIVERLREQPTMSMFANIGDMVGRLNHEREEAADEIERLREALHKVLGIVGNFPVDRFEYNVIREARAALEQAQPVAAGEKE